MINFFNVIWTLLGLIVAFSIYSYVVRPLWLLNYYKSYGAVTLFHSKSVGYFKNYDIAANGGDFFEVYKKILKQNPSTKCIAENFGDKVLFIPVDSEMVKEVLKRYDVYQKARDIVGLIPEWGNGSLFWAEGDQWKRQRKILSSAFTFDELRRVVPLIVSTTKQEFNEWEKKGQYKNLDILQKMGNIIGNIVGRFFFGKAFRNENLNGISIVNEAQKLLEDLGAEQFTLATAICGPGLARLKLFPRHRKFYERLEAFRAACGKMIKETEESEVKENNLANQLIKLKKSEDPGTRYNDMMIIGEFTALLVAGTDTTALLITIALYYLTKLPHIYERVKKEVDTYIKDFENLSQEDANNLEYTTAFLKEVMRVSPPTAALLYRVAAKDDDLCGVKVKKGTFVNTFFPLLHDSEKFYSQTEEFIPERWLNDSRFSKDGCKNDGYSFISFSAGPRFCAGQPLAMLEAKIVLAMLIKTFKITPSDTDYKPKLVQWVTYSPLEPFLVNLESRK